MPFLKLVITTFKDDLLVPLLLVISYFVFIFIVRGGTPSAEALVATFGHLYQRFGVEIVAVAAFVEALVLVNVFTPGMVTLVLGVLFARTGQTDLHLIVLAASAGAILGYILDFMLGLFGFSDIVINTGYGRILLKARQKVTHFGAKALIVGFAHPNIGSFLAFAAGTLRLPFLPFLALTTLSTIFWMCTWGLLVYLIGDAVLVLITRYSLLILGVIIAGMLLMKMWGGKLSK